jgi:hypothetical protein
MNNIKPSSVINNYLYTYRLGLELPTIQNSSRQMYDIIAEWFADDKEAHYDGQLTMTTNLYNKYNLLMYPLPQFWELYNGIKDSFRSLPEVKEEDPYFIQCWLNIYNKEDYIDWHQHWEPEYNSYHGYYCALGENTITSYILPTGHPVDVINHDDQLVIGKADGDYHRSHPWKGEGDRITIAFDIIPAESIGYGINHWIPL